MGLTLPPFGDNSIIVRARKISKYCLSAASSNIRPERKFLRIFIAMVGGFIIGVSSAILLSKNSNIQTEFMEAYHNYCKCNRTSEIQAATGTHANIGYQFGQRRHRIFCWILTAPKYHEKKARYVRSTWARRCDKFVFVSSQNDSTLPSIDPGVTEGYNFVWTKTKAAFRYAYTHYLNDCDFFLKADDDTYVVLENLRYILKDIKPSEPIYIGRRFRAFLPQGFLSGGAGYVLSREAVRRFVEEAFTNTSNKCNKGPSGPEDVNMAICLSTVGVKLVDSMDELGRERFHPFEPWMQLHPNAFGRRSWIWNHNYYPLIMGPECCSNTSVSFHYVDPGQMMALDFLIYQMQPHAASVYHTQSCNRTIVIDDSSDRKAKQGHNIELASLRRSASDAVFDFNDMKNMF